MSSARKTASMSLAQIRIEDGWVLDGFVRRAVEQDASLVQDEDALDGPEQDLEAMFDDHEGKAVLLAEGGDAVEDFLRELRRDARGGFVEQQQFRVRHPRSRDLEQLHLPPRNVRRPVQSDGLELVPGEDLEGIRREALLLVFPTRPEGRVRQALPFLISRGHEGVLQDRHAAEQAGGPGASARTPPGDGPMIASLSSLPPRHSSGVTRPVKG